LDDLEGDCMTTSVILATAGFFAKVLVY